MTAGDLTVGPDTIRLDPRRYLPMRAVEAIVITLLALLVSMLLFGVFLALAGANPVKVYELMYTGAFGKAFSWRNTLTRAAPIMLTGLCTALPARLGMVIIGGEGAMVIGGLSAAGMAMALGNAPASIMLPSLLLTASIGGGLWIVLAGALRQYRGVNETICSLLLNYIAIAVLNHLVEGPWKDPASLNNPSTPPIGDANMLGSLPWFDVHWGLGFGIIACIICYILMQHTVVGFAADIVGGNVRAAKVAGLSIGKIAMGLCFIAGAAAGLAGGVEVTAIHGKANAALISGYGYTGILVAFIARHNPLAIIPVSILLGGIAASGGLLQRRLHLPDATVVVLQGLLFLVILGFETFYGRMKWLQRPEVIHG